MGVRDTLPAPAARIQFEVVTAAGVVAACFDAPDLARRFMAERASRGVDGLQLFEVTYHAPTRRRVGGRRQPQLRVA